MTNDVNKELLLEALGWAQQEAKKPEIAREWDQSDWTRDAKRRERAMAENAVYDEMARNDDPAPSGRYSFAEYDEWSSRFRARVDVVLANIRATNECKTSYCIAGYVGKITGYDFSDSDEGVESWAMLKLGIDANQADALFDGDNTIEQVATVTNDILEGRI